MKCPHSEQVPCSAGLGTDVLSGETWGDEEGDVCELSRVKARRLASHSPPDLTPQF